MTKRLLKTFEEENNLTNALVPLTLDVDEVFFVYHHNVSSRKLQNCARVINKYKQVKVLYKKVNEDEIKDLIDEDTIIDISAAKYLSIVLYEVALRNDLPVIYYDEEEKVIKQYKNHEIISKDIFKLKIEDIVALGGGTILSYLHKPVNDRNSIDLIYKAVESAKNQYSNFTSYISRINSYVSDFDYRDNKIFLNEATTRRIVSDEAYQKYQDLGLFTLNGTELTFFNNDIKKLFMVTGAFLENYIYHKLIDSNLFDDILMSSTIEFNDEQWKYPVTCEIDCLVLKDNNLLFVSIKSNKTEKDDLNEIKVHNVMFGNKQSKPVICMLSDLSLKRPSIYAKAEELNVYVIDSTAFIKDNIPETFLSIIDGTYEYERI